jgi:MFS family permease
MLKFMVLYGIPLAADIMVSLVLFVGRHSLASRGVDEATVGSVVLCYGIGYVIASMLMTRIVRPRHAKAQMLAALGGILAACVILANVQDLLVIQILYVIFPFATSLLFNAFQIYMLGMATQDARPLATMAGHFTLSWSIGYALGPFVSSLLKNAFAWSQIYYLAAFIAAAIAGILYSYKPGPKATEAQATVVQRDSRPSLAGPAWVGLLTGWTFWNVVLIYWAVQAVQLGVSANLKGLVEFVAALAQGLAALGLTYVKGWHHKPFWFVLLGGSGVVALTMLGLQNHQSWFVVGALLYGVYTGSVFSALVYHAMIEESKAVQRVALNETFVGLCFLISSPLASWLHRTGTPFGGTYLLLAAILAAGVGGQAVYINRVNRGAVPVQ